MLEQGYINQSDYEEAMSDDVFSRIQQAESQQTTTTSVYSYFEDEVIDQAIDSLVSVKGYTETQARNILYSAA